MTSLRGGDSLRLTIYADGAATARAAGAGVVVIDTHRQVIALANQPLPVMTNNEAEYAGLLLALVTALRLGATEVEIRLDSEVVVGQMNGVCAVNSPKLKPLHSQACEQARRLARVGYHHIPRRQNALADALAAEAAAGRVWTSGNPPLPKG